ncbi:MAG: 5-bromo-4-chloroindolyl phosphate hydrolysis family protein [Eubacteriales bacterium]|nr:5-bromo-4-chloroindolyl phosphate hydrolysis family protein [Eubacteriales bacterium]
MAGRGNRKFKIAPLLGFGLSFAGLAAALPMQKLWAILLTAAVSGLIAFLLGRSSAKKEQKKQQEELAKAREQAKAAAAKKSYGPDVDPIIAEGNRALSEMGRLYMSIKDPEVRQKINEIMRITDKITQDAIADPSDIPQIKKFMNYYLPTTIKLLNAYDRMSSQGIEGENLDRSMKSINEMLDQAIVAYKKRLDSLFENQALDIETDIEVMNTMLAREGLSGGKDFDI